MTDATSPTTVDPALAAPMGAAAKRFAATVAALRQFLQLPNVTLLAAGLLLPNVLSFAAASSLIDIGLPPRTGCIILYATLAICARRLPFALTAVLFVAILGFDLVWTLSLMFGLAPSELMAALDHAKRIHFFASPLYATMIAVIATTTIATLFLLSRRLVLVRGNVYALFGFALAFAVFDYVSNISAHYQYGSMYGRSQPVASAADISGFDTVAGANGRNVVVVIVESLGYMIDPTARARIAAPLYEPGIAQKYVVTAGNTTYYGSTTAGEMRELCDTRVFYADYVKKYGYSCLPKLLQRRGYVSLAVHGFSGGMFGRQFWYPGLGFDKVIFGDRLSKETHRLCGSAFRGVCDADLAPVIVSEAKKLGPRTSRA